VLAYMIEQRGTRSISEMYVDILKGLKKRGTREEGRQDKVGKRSWEWESCPSTFHWKSAPMIVT